MGKKLIFTIRPYRPEDEEQVKDLAYRAVVDGCKPILCFTSMETVQSTHLDT